MKLNYFMLLFTAAHCSLLVASDEQTPIPLGFRDDFIEKQDDAWDILNPNLDAVSFATRSEMLTITTEAGGIWNTYSNAKNIFLIDTPPSLSNFVVTTRLVKFDPQVRYQQAGLICFNDEDNYVKFVLEFDPQNGGRTLAVVPEMSGKDQPNAYLKVTDTVDDLWLRVIVYDGTMVFSASRDGVAFRTVAIQKSEIERPDRLGLIAKNGVPKQTPGLDASFDFFEVASLESKPDVKAQLLKELEF